MAQFVDLTGRVFGSLTVVERDRVVNGGWHWICRCTCGNVKSVRSCSLIQGATKSCGCLMQLASTIHGLTKTKEHRTWQGMQQRCHNPNNKDYKSYGGRGIRVCDEWREDFLNFLNDVGYAPSKDHTKSMERYDSSMKHRAVPHRIAAAEQLYSFVYKDTKLRRNKNLITFKELC